MEAAERGNFSALPPEKTIAEAPDLSAFERSNLLALHRKAAQQLATLQRGMERFADPASRPFDPFDANDRAEVDALYRKLGANPEALAAVFRRTGLVPQSAIASFRDELGSNDPARVQAAAENLSGMLERNPDALTGIVGGSGELEDTALAYRHLVDDRGLTKEAAGAALIEMHAAGEGGLVRGASEALARSIRTETGEGAAESATEFSSQGKGISAITAALAAAARLIQRLGKNPESPQRLPERMPPTESIALPEAAPDSVSVPKDVPTQPERKLESDAKPAKTDAPQSPLAAPSDVDAAGKRPLVAIKPEENANVVSRLRSAFEQAMLAPPQNAEPVRVGITTPEGAARLNTELRAAGFKIDTTGFHHEVDAFAARHTFNRHGDAKSEAPWGQLPVTADDWALIPDIVANPDRITAGRHAGKLSIVYSNQVDGHVVYVEEVRRGVRTLAAKTMWKKIVDLDK